MLAECCTAHGPSLPAFPRPGLPHTAFHTPDTPAVKIRRPCRPCLVPNHNHLRPAFPSLSPPDYPHALRALHACRALRLYLVATPLAIFVVITSAAAPPPPVSLVSLPSRPSIPRRQSPPPCIKVVKPSAQYLNIHTSPLVLEPCPRLY
jgi:hypothetical protein